MSSSQISQKSTSKFSIKPSKTHQVKQRKKQPLASLLSLVPDSTNTFKPKINLEPKTLTSSSKINLTEVKLKPDLSGVSQKPDTPPKEKKTKGHRTQNRKKHLGRCMARTGTGSQCAKSRKEESEYCGCHHKTRPYGRYDGPLEGKFLIPPKKKGRKFKDTKEWSLEDLDLDLYVPTQLIIVDGQKFLLDPNGMLYSNDNQCQIVGRTQGDLIHWYI